MRLASFLVDLDESGLLPTEYGISLERLIPRGHGQAPG